MTIFKTSSAEDTKKIAGQLAAKLKEGGVVTLSGPLGSGKTTFTQGFALSLGIEDKLISPTFILVKSYPIPKSSRQLVHIDLYRLDNPGQAHNLGLEELIKSHQNIILIEWPEKLDKDFFPAQTLRICFKILGENSRQIEVA